MTGGSLGQAGRLERRARELPPGAPVGAWVPRRVALALGFLVFPCVRPAWSSLRGRAAAQADRNELLRLAEQSPGPGLDLAVLGTHSWTMPLSGHRKVSPGVERLSLQSVLPVPPACYLFRKYQ